MAEAPDRDALIQQLAKVFDDAPKARRLLELSGVPVEQIPPWGQPAPLDYWRTVCREADHGLVAGGVAALVGAAAGEYRHNPVFSRWVAAPVSAEPAAGASRGSARPGNPFGAMGALREAARFVGREAALRRLRGMLEVGSVALLGAPKVGKSSLVWRLVEGWDGEVVGPVDVQGLEDAADFYSTIADALGVGGDGWRPLRAALRARRVLLVVDELDHGPEIGLGGADLQRFRAVCGENSEFRMVTVGRCALKEIFPDSGKGSPGYNFLPPWTLGAMPESEVRAILAAPWEPAAPSFDEGSVAEIVRFAQGHPFKAQRGGYHRWVAMEEEGHDWRRMMEVDWEHLR